MGRQLGSNCKYSLTFSLKSVYVSFRKQKFTLDKKHPNSSQICYSNSPSVIHKVGLWMKSKIEIKFNI